MLICSKCGIRLAEGMKFCVDCGALGIEALCSNCSAKLIEGKKFCIECGTYTGASGSRLTGTSGLKPLPPDAGIPKTAETASKKSEKFVHIKTGTFKMGSPDNELKRNDDEDPQNHVTVSSFYMCKYQVTQKEFKDVMGINPSNFKGDNLPVEMINWYDAVEYCNRLSLKEELVPAYSLLENTNPDNWEFKGSKWDSIIIVPDSNGYRLPTEAQWEYACRAGTTTPFNTGNNITSDQANYDGTTPYGNNPSGLNRKETTPVGSFPANPWGLYDMHGNVWEWCWDWKENYTKGLLIDPTGAPIGKYRAERGGSWCSGAHNLRSACRSYDFPSIKGHNDGFRLVLPG